MTPKRKLHIYNRRGERAPAGFNFSVSKFGRVPVKIFKAGVPLAPDQRKPALVHAEKSCWPHPKGHISFFADGSCKDNPFSTISKKHKRFVTAVCVTWRPVSNDCNKWDKCIVKTFWIDDNNTAEAYAAFVAVQTAIDESAWDPEVHTIIIYTDSQNLLELLEEFDRTEDGEWVILHKQPRIDIIEMWRLVDALDVLVHKCGKKVEMRWVPSHVYGESFGHWLVDNNAKKAADEEITRMRKAGPGHTYAAETPVDWHLYCHE